MTIRQAFAPWQDEHRPEIRHEGEVGGHVEAAHTILVIDDVPTNIRLLEAILGAAGYHVISAGSGQDGLNAIGRHNVDLVLLDVNMPGMTGHEVCRRIREADPNRLLPIVMVTSGADESTVTAIDAGADDFVTRPFDQAELLARVRSLLRIKQLHDTVETQADELAVLNRDLQARVDEQLDELLHLRRLQRFLSPQLAEVVLSAGDDALLEPHRREIAVAFCDLRGFTRFAAAVEPEELLDALREFHALLGELVTHHGATVGYFDGDGVMLFFNDPVPCADPALKAARLAIDLRDGFGPLRDGWRRRGHDLDLGIGISLGFATLGIIGFEGRYDYTALGPVVNQASRLCTAAAGGQILAGASATAALDGVIQADAIEPVTAKGFTDPIPASSINGLIAGQPAATTGARRRTEFRVLGPLEVVVDGVALEFPAGKERALLSRLIADANRVVSVDQLVDDLWEGHPPEAAGTSLRVHVSRVRKALAAAGADALIVTKSPGYVLETDPESIDANRFEALVAQARGDLGDGAPTRTSEALRDALALWRGPALSEVAAAPNVAPEAGRLDELRLTAVEDRIDAELRCGHHAALIGELQALVQAHPLRERVWGQLMIALYRTGRQADALRTFQDLRTALADEVGLDPSPALARLEAAILSHDPTLDWSPAQ